MRSYRIRLGDTETTVPVPAPATNDMVAARPMSETKQSIIVATQLMGVAALPWIPVLGGAWLGRRYWDSTGKWVGGLTGFALSIAILSGTLRKIG